MEILIISGLSGSGKSRTAAFLEDIGYYIVDNLPAEMMLKFANFCTASGGRYDRVALVYDVRAGEPFQRLIDVQDKLRRRDNVRCRMLFLEADTRVIISRYKETRRTHPLCTEGGSIEEAVKRERELLDPVRARADFVLDTTAFSTAKLRSELLNLFGGVGTRQPLNVSVMSFGFKNGLPMEADLVFDVRFLPNPYYVPELKPLTGLDEPVREYVFSSEAAGRTDGAGHRRGLHRRAASLDGGGPSSGHIHRGAGLPCVRKPSGYFTVRGRRTDAVICVQGEK